MSKRKMIEGLLEAHEYAITAGPPVECSRQFNSWLHRVASALDRAGMGEDHAEWCDAMGHTEFYDGDMTFAAQSESMKAILVGILARLEETEPPGELFEIELVEGTRSYIEKLAPQANGCYQRGWYDSCAVMVRRVVELLIIDCFAQHNITTKIQNADGEYFGLSLLIRRFLEESAWHVPRSVRRHLPKLKDLKEIGDKGAHGRHCVTRTEIENLAKATINLFQWLIEIAYPEN